MRPRSSWSLLSAELAWTRTHHCSCLASKGVAVPVDDLDGHRHADAGLTKYDPGCSKSASKKRRKHMIDTDVNKIVRQILSIAAYRSNTLDYTSNGETQVQ